MIIVSDRKLLIPSGEKHIGFTGDNLVEERVFAINNKKIFDLEFRIDLQNTGETIVLGKRISGDGKLLFLTWEITSGVLTTTPMIEFQLRGFEPEGERVWHSEKNSFYTDSSIDASNELTPEEIDEFHVIEKQVALYRNQAEEFCSQSEENCLEAQGLRNESEAFRNEAQGFMEQAQEFRNEAKDLAQQSLADYTELKENVYTKDETDTKIASDINAVIVQDVGEDETKVMSQKAVTEGLMRFDEVINTHIDEVVNNKADADKVYTKDENDNIGFNNESSHVINSSNSIASGTQNVIGAKGYYYNHIDFISKQIYLTLEQPSFNEITIFNTEGAMNSAPLFLLDTSFPTPEYAVGNGISLINAGKYDYKSGSNCTATIKSIDHNCITYEGELGFTAIKDCGGTPNLDDYTLYVPAQPDIGIVTVREGSQGFGDRVVSTGLYSHAEGRQTRAHGHYSHAEGRATYANYAAHAEGESTNAYGARSHAEGHYSTAQGEVSHAEGYNTKALGLYSHAEGRQTEAHGDSSHAEGHYARAFGDYSHAEGYYTEAKGDFSHAEGWYAWAYGLYSHAEGVQNRAYEEAEGSHVEGNHNNAYGRATHVEGKFNEAYGECNHVEGNQNTSTHKNVHIEGMRNISTCDGQHIQGQYNSTVNCEDKVHIVGWGSSVADRKNIHTLDKDGNAYYSGYGEFTSIILKSSTMGSNKRFMLSIDDSGSLSIKEV